MLNICYNLKKIIKWNKIKWECKQVPYYNYNINYLSTVQHIKKKFRIQYKLISVKEPLNNLSLLHKDDPNYNNTISNSSFLFASYDFCGHIVHSSKLNPLNCKQTAKSQLSPILQLTAKSTVFSYMLWKSNYFSFSTLSQSHVRRHIGLVNEDLPLCWKFSWPVRYVGFSNPFSFFSFHHQLFRSLVVKFLEPEDTSILSSRCILGMYFIF